MSSYANVESGEPQGSVLGPCQKAQCTVRLFADDTIVNMSVPSESDTQIL